MLRYYVKFRIGHVPLQSPNALQHNRTKQGTSSLRNLTLAESEYIQLSEKMFGEASMTHILAPL